MKDYIDRMKEFLTYLPSKDKELCKELIIQRKFTTLYDIVVSDIRKIQRRARSISINDVNIVDNINMLGMFKLLIEEYISKIDLDYEEDDI